MLSDPFGMNKSFIERQMHFCAIKKACQNALFGIIEFIFPPIRSTYLKRSNKLSEEDAMKSGRTFVMCLIVIGLLVSLSGCSSGGDDGAIITPVSQATITGTVAGTTVIAYDTGTGLEVARDTATGDPKTFSLTLPTPGSYEIYLVENEGPNQRIFPLYSGTTNVFTLAGGSTQTIDLGYVDTSSGRAIPANDPLAVAGVTPAGESTVVPDDLAASAFTLADMEGDWHFHGMVVGYRSDFTAPCWYRGTSTIDNNGNVSTNIEYGFNYVTSATSVIESVTPAGVILPQPSDGGRRILFLDKQTTINVSTSLYEAGTGYSLHISQKAGSVTYSTADMEGTWRYHALSADPGYAHAYWSYGDIVSDASGDCSPFTAYMAPESVGQPVSTGMVSNLSFSVSADGVVSEATEGPTFHGYMSQNKSMIVATHNSGIDYTLLILLKSDPAVAFSADDLQGTWTMHSLVTGKAGQSGPQAWGTGTAIVSGGTIAYKNRKVNGNPYNDASYTISISSEGVVDHPDGTQSFHAVMSDDKQMMIGISRDGGEYGYILNVYQR